MMRSAFVASAILAVLATWACMALADATDLYINQLKDPNPDVRAKAAFELSCG
ncbi:MAG: hypothetical protein LDL33_12630 [Desulfomonile sp.]|nr:hypothetical protein [Desulfomonile sp.]